MIQSTNNVRQKFVKRIEDELDHAYSKHGMVPWGRHEFYAILLEEVDELWDAIKADESLEELLAEMIQVAAMCFRYAETNEDIRKLLKRPKLP
jgi:NTP pyrophosphatase (non-canonical NTP hydrolase)